MDQPTAGDDDQPTLLRELLRQRYWQSYPKFCKEYDRVARQLDKRLVGTGPSLSQYKRWLRGDMTRLPRWEPCAVLDAMFPEHRVEDLFRRRNDEPVPVASVSLDAMRATNVVGISQVDVEEPGAHQLDPVTFLSQISIESPVPERIEWSEVEHVRSTTRAVATAENVFGGGLSCEAAMGQLRWAGKLLGARADDEVRRGLFEAVGNLSSVVAYSAFDVAAHSAADRCFQLALWCSDQSGSWALRANTLAEMSRKSAYLGDLDGALSLIEFAQVRSDRLTNKARAMLCALRARVLALTGRSREALSDIDRADAYFHDSAAESNPPWLVYYDVAEHQGSIGKALVPIAEAAQDMDLAAPRLREAIERHQASYPRSRAFSRTRLATLTMHLGDPRDAVAIGRHLLDDVASLRSQRITRELRGFAKVSDRHSVISDVRDLRHDVMTLISKA